MNERKYDILQTIIVIFCGVGAVYFGVVYGQKIFKNSTEAILISLFAWIIICMVVINPIFKLLRNKKQKDILETMPEKQIQAKIIEKKEQLAVSDYNNFGNRVENTYSYSMMFEFSDGRRKTFPVSQNLYNESIEGDTGILTYKQNGEQFYFVRFERQI